MILSVRVIPRAKVNSVCETSGGLKVRLSAVPEDNKANQALIEILAEHFKVKKNQVAIIQGGRSRSKTVQIFR